MATFIIGDVHGCLEPLEKLLREINYKEDRDFIWFIGDIINRGPNSLEVLKWVYERTNVGQANTILGNHELGLLVYNTTRHLSEKHDFDEILFDKNSADYLNFIKTRPLLNFFEEFNTLIVHAGLYKTWDIKNSITYARDCENVIKNADDSFFKKVFDNGVNIWSDELVGMPRYQMILNVCLKIRFCYRDGSLNYNEKGSPNNTHDKNVIPWFSLNGRESQDTKIIFGHWSALNGITPESANVVALDTGCVWKKYLSAFKLESGDKYSVKNE